MMKLRSLLLAPLVGLLACHDDKSTEPVTPPAPTMAPAPSPATTSTATRASTGMTTTGVYVDASIASLCGIPQPRVFFTFDSANVQNNDSDTLERLAQCASSGPLKGKSLDVVGRTDPRGSDEYNKQLGQSRADTVAGLLTARGIDRAMVNARSTGEDRATGNDENGWAYDRRVDIRLARGTGSGTTGDTSTSGSSTSGTSGSGTSGSGATGSGTSASGTTGVSSGSGSTGGSASGATGGSSTSGSTGTSGSATGKGATTGTKGSGTKGTTSGGGTR